jgi:hypothetical protein
MAVHATGAQGVRFSFGSLPGGQGSTFAAGFVYDLPFNRTELYNTDGGVQWGSAMLEQVQVPGDEFPRFISDLERGPVTYRAGRTVHEEWNKGVFGPALPTPPDPHLWVTRTGDDMFVDLPLYGDGSGHAGFSLTDKARTALFRDGTLVGETQDAGFGFFTVPAGSAAYRLETEADRGTPFGLSTHISCVWTFHSGHVAGTDPAALPLSAIRFLPQLDQTSSAPAGRLFVVPITVQPQPGSAAGRLKDLTVQVSYDDGATWRAVLVQRVPGGALIILFHPKEGGFVSLRATASDTAGNTVQETIIRAYRTVPRG